MSKGFGRGGQREGSGRKPKYLTDSETSGVVFSWYTHTALRRIVEVINELIEQGFTACSPTAILQKLSM